MPQTLSQGEESTKSPLMEETLEENVLEKESESLGVICCALSALSNKGLGVAGLKKGIRCSVQKSSQFTVQLLMFNTQLQVYCFPFLDFFIFNANLD